MTPDMLPQHDDGLGNLRPLGNLPSDPKFKALVPTWTEVGNDLIPEADWREFEERPSVLKIHDQDGAGACNPHSAIHGLEGVRYVAGMPYIPLDPWSLYARLTGGWDSGSNCLDALKMLQDEGTCIEGSQPYKDFNPRHISDKAKAEFPRFKVEIGSQLATYEELGSAIQLRRPINLSITVGGGFNNLDSDGVPPLGWGPNNHAVCVMFGMKKSAKWGWLGLMKNSWGTQWGDGGFCWLPLKEVVQGRAFEAYTVIAPTSDPLDPNKPPVLV